MSSGQSKQNRKQRARPHSSPAATTGSERVVFDESLLTPEEKKHIEWMKARQRIIDTTTPDTKPTFLSTPCYGSKGIWGGGGCLSCTGARSTEFTARGAGQLPM